MTDLWTDERGFIGTAAAILTAVAAGASAGTSIYAAKKQAQTAKDVAGIQKEASDKALAYEQARDRYGTTTEANRYAALMQGVSPYIATGGAADARMAALLGLPEPTAPSPAPPTYPAPPIPGTPETPTSAEPAPREPWMRTATQLPQRLHEALATRAAAGGTTPPTGPLVTMQAPDRTVKQVPVAEQAHWEARGGKKVA